MRADSGRWTEVAPSRHAHERDGLEHVRDQLPDAAPYHAWSNVEFVALDGTPYEVDLVVLGPAGFHLVELKAWSGKIEQDRSGGENDWLEHPPGRGRPLQRRNPLGLTRLKAQSFRSWLEHHARGTGTRVPYVHESLFLHGTQVDCRLPDRLKARIFGREDATGNGLRGLVLGRLTADPERGSAVDQAWARALERLVASAGLRTPSRRPAVGHWVLEEDGPYDAGWGWRDDLAHHPQYADEVVRVRRWFAPPGTSAAEEAAIRRAADREYRTLRGLEHPGLLLPRDSFEVEGAVAALVFDRDAQDVDLASWVTGPGRDADLMRRLDVLRRAAEVVRYAHDHGLAHRGLAPHAVLVGREDKVRVTDWQLGGSLESATATVTSHVRELARHDTSDDRVYAAPEVARGTSNDRRAADVFSLGALAYLLLTGAPPAEDEVTLRERLSRDGGLDVSALLDAPPESLVEMVRGATAPVVASRTPSVEELLSWLDMVLDDLTAPDEEPAVVVDPLDAQPGAELDRGLTVKRVLGEGATSRAFLVERPDGTLAVLKAARDDARAGRLVEEAQVLRRLPGDREVVHLLEGPIEVGGRTCLLVELAGERTLAHHLGGERLTLDQLRRWGGDLIDLLGVLERAGMFHRDLKPANLGVRTRAADGQPHLVLFDFSLGSVSVDDLTAGTVGYRDPFLGPPSRPAYDASAEAFSAAATLHEMATGALPVWGDGRTPPDVLDVEVTVRRAAFDETVADGLTAFFRRALARDATERFDNPQQMRQAWEQVFVEAEERETERTPDQDAAAATLATPLPRSGLSARAVSALEQYAVATVGDLLGVSLFDLSRTPGATQSTKDEITSRVRVWRDRLTSDAQPSAASVDAVLGRLLPVGEEPRVRAVRLLLGQVDGETGAGPLAWPTTTLVSNEIDLDRPAVTEAWRQHLDNLGGRDLESLRDDVSEILQALGGAAAADEVATRLVDRRGSFATGEARRAQALALVRVVVEPRDSGMVLRTSGDVVLVVGGSGLDATAADEALDVLVRLGAEAQSISQQDALAAPATVDEALRNVAAGVLDDVGDARLRDLAAAAAGDVAVSARGELYPRGMAVQRAVRLCAAALVPGPNGLHPRSVAQRVRSRFPEAQPLPDRPLLDELLKHPDLDLEFEGDVYVGRGARSTRASATSTSHHGAGDADLARIDAVLERVVADHGFLALNVPQRYADAATRRLLGELDAEVVDLGIEVARRLRAMADEHGADWSFLLAADSPVADAATKQELDGYVRHVADAALTDSLARSARPLLLVGAGVLARHQCADLVKPLASLAATRSRAVWLLAPQPATTANPTLDGAALPLDSPTTQWLALPARWALTQPADPPAARPAS